MTIIQSAQSVRNLLESAPPKLAVPLSKPWHYRRNGRYYLRLRTRERPYSTFTVSLRTTDRAIAMEDSQKIQGALAYFHLDRPEATWEELRARLIAIAEECLASRYGVASDFAQSEAYKGMYIALRQHSASADVSLPQHKALIEGQRILLAAQARLDGRSGGLVGVIERLNDEAIRDSHTRASASLSVGAPQEPLSWSKLSELYMADVGVNHKESSHAMALAIHKIIGETFEAIGVTDLRKHTREDLITLRSKLLEDRTPSTVNNQLSQLIAVLNWGFRADKLTKTYTEKLRLTKGTESARIAFTRDQVVTLMDHAGKLPATSWERWAISLAVITGARQGEIAYLTPEDIKEVDGLWCIDINEDGPGKSVKNKSSVRKVPLVDGALGFDLQTFLQAVQAGALPSAHGITPERSSKVLNPWIRKALGDSKDKNQSLHSLRHHLASSMQAAGVERQFAQAVTGHADGSITYGTYGSSIPVQKANEAIRKGLMGDTQ